MKLLLILIFILPACGVRGIETVPLPGGSVATYVRAQTRIFGLGVYDRYLYDSQTGKDTFVRSDCTEPLKLENALKGLPVPVMP